MGLGKKFNVFKRNLGKKLKNVSGLGRKLGKGLAVVGGFTGNPALVGAGLGIERGSNVVNRYT